MRGVLLSALALALAPTLATAQERYGPSEGSHEFALSGTGTSDKDFENGGFGITGNYGYYLDQNWMVGVRQTFSWADSGDSNWIGSTRGAVDYHFGTGRWRPFIGANLGFVYGDDVDGTGIVSPEVGLKYYANQTTFIYGMAEYQVFFEDSDDLEANYDDSAFVYTVGVGFNF